MFPLLESALKAGAGDTKNHCLLMNSRQLRWHALKYLFGPRYKSMLDKALLKVFSCFNSVSHVKNQDRTTPVSASFCLLALWSSQERGWSSLAKIWNFHFVGKLLFWFCPMLEDKLGISLPSETKESLDLSQTCFNKKHI